MTEIPPIVLFLRDSFVRYRQFIIWTVLLAALLWLMLKVPEVTALLVLSYVIAILIDPAVTRIQELGLSRPMAVVVVFVLFLLFVTLALLIIVPALITQGMNLADNIPHYIDSFAKQFNSQLQKFFGMSSREAVDAFWESVRVRAQAMTADGLRPLFTAISGTLLRGYSITLTLVNFILLPFFVFYITKDLRRINKFLAQLFTPPMRVKARKLGTEVVNVLRAFLRGQLTVCMVSALLYATLLSIVGLQSGFAIGLLTGLLNFIPFLGTAVGLTLTTLVAFVTEPHWLGVFLAWGAFGVSNSVTDNVISPKIMSDSLGLHPLGVLLAIFIGGHLLGLLGIIIAIPAAAILRVLFQHFALQDDDAEPVRSSARK